MDYSLAAYLPQDRRDALARNADLPETTSGAALFADISGFTPLTEALAQALGPRRGAEALTNQINTVYDALIEQVDAYHGSVVGFAGDAITCWFDDANCAAAQRAAACALAMQRAMHAFAAISLPGGSSTALSIKVALASGPARRFAVGDPQLQRIDVLAGATITRVAAAEHLASRGEIVIDAATADALGPDAVLSGWRDDTEAGLECAVLAELHAYPATQPWPPLSPDDLPAAKIRPWVLPSVFERVQAGVDAFITELRPATALFLRFEDIDYDQEPNAGEILNQFICAVQRELARHESTLIQLTIGDKGCYLSAGFGTPVAHEDDPQRAVLSALALQEIVAELGRPAWLQIGISQGTMRCGAYGGSTCRTYGMLGDDVNLAARLMSQAARGEILVSDRVQQALGGRFSLEPRPPLPLKGKADPLPIFAVRGVRRVRAVRLQEPIYGLPMIGRADELGAIARAIALTLTRQGQIVGVVAEAGMGKSRLVDEGIRLARQRGFSCYGGACQATATTAPYLVWESIWRAFFDIDPEMPLRRQARALAGLIDDWAPARADALPLLGQLLGLPLPENDFTRALEPRDRQSALHALLIDCLAAAANETREDGGALLLVLEDLHWIDPASHALLLEIGQAIADLPVLVVLAYRPTDPGESRSAAFAALPHFWRISLPPLGVAAVEQLIWAKLVQLYPARGGALAPELIAQLAERAQGNPFFVEELLNYLHDRAIDPRDAGALAALDLPASLHRLIFSRLDALSMRQQIVLKVASVIGRRFLVAWLQGAFPAIAAPESIAAELATLARLDLTPLDTPEPELAYLFKHIVTREVAYESLSSATRATLHGQLAGYIEQLAGADVDRFLDLLAYHYQHSDNIAKQRVYLRRAGVAAAARYANDAAVSYLSRALELAPAVEHDERYALLLAREQVYGLQGARAAQSADLEALDELAASSGDHARQAEIALRRARYAERTGEYRVALDAAQRAVAHARVAGRSDLEAAGRQRWGWVLVRQRKYAEAHEQLEQSLALAQAHDNRHLECLIFNDLGGLAADQGDFAQAHDRYTHSLAIAVASGDRVQACAILNNLGTIAAEQGDIAGAQGHLEQSSILARIIGDRKMESHTLGNLSFLAAQLGDFTLSRKMGEQSVALARAVDNRYQEGNALGTLGLVAINQGETSAARDYYSAALKIAQAIGDQVLAGWARRGLGSAALAEGDQDRAEEHYRASLEIMRGLGSPALAAEPLAGLARVALARQDVPSALAAAEQVLAHLQHGTLDGAEEPMLVYLSCYRALRAAADGRAEALLARAHAELQKQAAQISEPAARRQFLEQIPAHRGVVAAWAALQRQAVH